MAVRSSVRPLHVPAQPRGQGEVAVALGLVRTESEDRSYLGGRLVLLAFFEQAESEYVMSVQGFGPDSIDSRPAATAASRISLAFEDLPLLL